MTSEEKNIVKKLIVQVFRPSDTYHKRTSYALKSIFEQLADTYISNDDFKSLISECGYIGTNTHNARYKVKVQQRKDIRPEFWEDGGHSFTLTKK